MHNQEQNYMSNISDAFFIMMKSHSKLSFWLLKLNEISSKLRAQREL